MAAELPNTVETAAIVGPAGPYMDNLVTPWLLARLWERDEVAYPLPAELPIPWVAIDDVSAVVTELVVSEAPSPMQVVVGPELLTGELVASGLSEAIGKQVTYTTVSPQEWGEMLAPYLGQDSADGITEFYVALTQAPPPPPLDPAIVRSATTTLSTWASRQNWARP